MVDFLIQMIYMIIQLITLLVIVKVFLAYFMSPYQPLRLNIDRIIDPLLAPIRKIIPLVGMLDLSPIVLVIIVQLIGKIVISLLSSAA